MRFLILFIISTSLTAKDPCLPWFKDLKIEQDPKCMFSCLSAPTGMESFNCTKKCKELCQIKDPDPNAIYKTTYSGLSEEEIKLIIKHNKEALAVYSQKVESEKLTKKVFKRNDQGDESDAFRHFVWSGLLVKKIGPELAKKFLDAHESGQEYSSPDRAMDMANNYEGILTAIKLSKENRLTLDELEKEGIKEIKSKKLYILEPKGDLK